MANEYLRRTPTSTGNNRVFTWSGWVKRNIFAANYAASQNLFRASGGSGGDCGWRFDLATPADSLRLFLNGAASGNVQADGKNRDASAWMHIMVSFNSTLDQDSERIRIYVNGVRVPDNNTGYPTINYQTSFNERVVQAIGAWDNSGSPTEFFGGELTDVFFIDGQALTPDVFGFYKQGKGYISVGSTQATDFRPGQWVPKTPRVIKTEIIRRGGFGVNGFYLPMNDSKNFGADFHCDPNSIITLNEKLPQPRVGVATTASVGLGYTDALRADPYAANLVLAVPGISTSTAPNLITNGTFDTSTTGWTAVQATISAVNGNLRIVPNSGVNGGAYQSIITEVGKRYTVFMEVIAAAASWARLHVGTSTNIDSADKYTYTNATSVQNVGVGRYTVSFTPTTTTTIIWLEVGGGLQTQVDFDNVIVQQEDAPKDYSAFIKGSGTNKTITANGNAGVGYNIPSYYGSALSFDGSGDYFTSANSSDFYFNGDFTVEFWVYRNVTSTSETLVGVFENSVARRSWQIETRTNSALRFEWFSDGSSSSNITTANNSVPGGQWNHIAMVKKNNTITGYVNGVAAGINTNAGAIYQNTVDPLRIGVLNAAEDQDFKGYLQDLRIYKDVAKYTGGFDVPRPYTPVGIATWRAVPDTTANNFCTWNPLYPGWTGSAVENAEFTNGNLTVSESSSSISQGTGTIGVSTGKWYYEAIPSLITGANSNLIGIRPAEWFTFNPQNRTSWRNGGAVYDDAGNMLLSGTTYTTTDIIGIAFDMNNRRLWFSKNGSWVYSGDPNNNLNPAVSFASTYTHYTPFSAFDNVGGTESWTANFGQNPTFSGNTTAGTFTDSNGKGLFKYQPPTGFLALCEDNLPTPAISDPGKHFKTVLYTGDSAASRSIVGVGFTPDLIWLKDRVSTNNAQIFDSVRGFGGNKELTPSQTYAQGGGNSAIYGFVGSSNNDGFSYLTGSSNPNQANYNGDGIVAWCWRAGAGTTSTNTNGSITSVVSVNQDAGFSIVSYTGNGTAGATIGHGLGKTPSFIIIKDRTSGSNGWPVYHKSTGNTIFLYLNATSGSQVNSTAWNNTSPTSNVFTVGTGTLMNTNGNTYIAYCWAEIEGFSKAFSYVGNGSADGPMIYLGLKPALIIIKRTDNVGNWQIYDSSRMSTNPNNGVLFPNLSNVEGTGSAYDIDFLSNGFKLRSTDTDRNASGSTYVGFAWAESPFSTSNSK